MSTVDAQKLTQKSLEAVKNAQSMAIEYNNMQIENLHLAYALLSDSEGLIPQLVSKMNIQPAALLRAVQSGIEKLPKVTGPGREPDKVYVSRDCDRVLNEAEKTAARMQDEFVSVEHLFLALLEYPGSELKEAWKPFNLNKEAFLQALSTVRGSQRVTSDSPEETYDALKKYGKDLVEKHGRINWTRLSDVTTKSVTSSGFCPERRRITRCLSVSPASARRLWWKALPSGLSAGTCPIR